MLNVLSILLTGEQEIRHGSGKLQNTDLGIYESAFMMWHIKLEALCKSFFLHYYMAIQRATTDKAVNLIIHIMDTCSYMDKFFYSECYRVTVQANRHLGKNTADGIFSITRNTDVALMRPK